MDPKVVIALFGGCIALLLIIGAPLKPMRFIGQGLIRILIGALLLFFLNTFGTVINLYVPINIATASVSGFLGIPGIIALVCIKQFIM
ncbi:pro-sigmaK processing inhibitor BofA family protein [Pseudalkalibacillus caeni]|uniref:Pro-sigmaK processing inhibitor BofA n=1 Tax=Exobacillus caeni TaxID=2574798 RepID=A0A5R9EYA2_9BACL|nr:pro-sigmaK processing inhibitor BofA family protein [Pseudalkalibacillus caeni]TLS35020.1 pro-sigmaK processing inhibitor BofA [Pseudalkalibacillus caeni]